MAAAGLQPAPDRPGHPPFAYHHDGACHLDVRAVFRLDAPGAAAALGYARQPCKALAFLGDRLLGFLVADHLLQVGSRGPSWNTPLSQSLLAQSLLVCPSFASSCSGLLQHHQGISPSLATLRAQEYEKAEAQAAFLIRFTNANSCLVGLGFRIIAPASLT